MKNQTEIFKNPIYNCIKTMREITNDIHNFNRVLLFLVEIVKLILMEMQRTQTGQNNLGRKNKVGGPDFMSIKLKNSR